MSVPLILTTVTLMLSVLTPLVASPVSVMMATLEMDSNVWVSILACMDTQHACALTQSTCLHAEAPTPRFPTSVLLISITSSNATIQWMLTDPYILSRQETFTVFYGNSSGQFNSSTPDITANSNSQTYSTQLISLQPETVYFYKIRSMNYFDTVFTGEMSFLTNKESKL